MSNYHNIKSRSNQVATLVINEETRNRFPTYLYRKLWFICLRASSRLLSRAGAEVALWGERLLPRPSHKSPLL
jgi:hypothetical protein